MKLKLKLHFLLIFFIPLVTSQEDIFLISDMSKPTYELIESAFGTNSIESSDCLSDPPLPHITQEVDNDGGSGNSSFVFVLHVSDSDRTTVIFPRPSRGLKLPFPKLIRASSLPWLLQMDSICITKGGSMCPTLLNHPIN